MTAEVIAVDDVPLGPPGWWDALETHCVAACCGSDAFDLAAPAAHRAGGCLSAG